MKKKQKTNNKKTKQQKKQKQNNNNKKKKKKKKTQVDFSSKADWTTKPTKMSMRANEKKTVRTTQNLG